jgi:hypothetical protein
MAIGQNFTIGPVFGYDFGKAALTAYYNSSIYARNVAAGNNFWLRLDVPLTSPTLGKGFGSQSFVGYGANDAIFRHVCWWLVP